METGPWIDRERAIWKVLPLHPQPQPLESFTSYIMRLAEANGLKSINELATLAGTRWSRVHTSPDYPCPPYEGLARITGCTETRLGRMTFLPLAQYFGCPLHPRPLRRFFQSSLAPTLRYCPRCLAEQSSPYYSLIWRFQAVQGCPSHHCALLDQCGHCSSLLPHVTSFPRLIWCPICRGDLRTCRADSLSSALVQSTRIHTSDLEMLFSSPPWKQEGTPMAEIAKRFASQRHQRHLSMTEVAHLMGINERVILEIEYGNPNREATLSDYMQYADTLSSSLKEIFAAHLSQEYPSEKTVLEQVKATIQDLKAREEPILSKTIRMLIGISARELQQYPYVKTLLKRQKLERGRQTIQLNPQREEDLLKQVKQAIQQLESLGIPVSQERICAIVGMSRSWLRHYPQVRALFGEIAAKRKSNEAQSTRHQKSKPGFVAN